MVGQQFLDAGSHARWIGHVSAQLLPDGVGHERDGVHEIRFEFVDIGFRNNGNDGESAELHAHWQFLVGGVHAEIRLDDFRVGRLLSRELHVNTVLVSARFHSFALWYWAHWLNPLDPRLFVSRKQFVVAQLHSARFFPLLDEQIATGELHIRSGLVLARFGDVASVDGSSRKCRVCFRGCETSLVFVDVGHPRARFQHVVASLFEGGLEREHIQQAARRVFQSQIGFVGSRFCRSR